MSSSGCRSRSFQRLNRSLRLERAQWLKTQVVESEGKRTGCEEIKLIMWSRYGRISEQEIGRIIRIAFPGVRRGKHCSGYKYYYQDLVMKTPDIECVTTNNSMLYDTALVKENELLRKQVQSLEATHVKHDHVQQELKSTKQELKNAQKQLRNLKRHNNYYGKRLNKNTVTSASSLSSLTVTNDFTHIPSELLINIEMDDHTRSKHIGSGAFGMCTLKLYRNIEVSVKYLKDCSYQDLLNEAKVTKVLEGHPNLPILLGISPKNIKEKYIVTKFHGRDLKGIPLWYALKDKSCGIETKDFQFICYGTARGLLHMHIKGFLHNDLKQDNVVVDFIEGKPSPVIIDFGKSCTLSAGRIKKILPREREMYLKKHSHIAPELVDGSHKQAFSSDVYSFGILMNIVNRYIVNKGTGVIGNVADKCTNRIPTVRPNMDTVVEELK